MRQAVALSAAVNFDTTHGTRGRKPSLSKHAAATVTKSVVYLLPGFDADGKIVAGLLGIPPVAVQVLPTPLPTEVGNPGDAQIIVVLGPDAPVSTG